jgi:hypothetical protein
MPIVRPVTAHEGWELNNWNMKAQTCIAGIACLETMAMSLRTALAMRILPLLVLLALSVVVQAQFNDTTNNNVITIIQYNGFGDAVTIGKDTLVCRHRGCHLAPT